MMVACTPDTDSDAFISTAPTFATSTTSTTSSTTEREPTAPIRGVLPDGSVYDLDLGRNAPEEVQAIFASIDLDGQNLWGIAEAGREPVADPWEEDGVFYLQAWEWVFRFVIDPEVVSALGPDYRETIESQIRLTDVLGYPVLTLLPPFSWAEDTVIRKTQVLYYTFVVRRGCGDLALQCSSDQRAQFIPIPRTGRPLLPWEQRGDDLIEAIQPLQGWYRGSPSSDPYAQ
jgi:hypothetical protein